MLLLPLCAPATAQQDAASPDADDRDAGFAPDSVDAARVFDTTRAPTLPDLLAGQVPGLFVRGSSGSVGTGSTFRLRGPTSLQLDDTPLVYVDGVRVSNANARLQRDPDEPLGTGGQQTSRLTDLATGDMASIRVLEGPAAAAMYGSDAAAGVIRIESRRPERSDPRWLIRGQLGANWDATDWPARPLNPSGFFGLPEDTVYLMNLLEEGTAGISPPFRTGGEQDVAASVAGGAPAAGLSYYVSGGHEDRDGSLPTDELARWRGRANAGFSAGDRVNLSLSTGFTSTRVTLPQNGRSALGYLGNGLFGRPSFLPFEREDPFGSAGRVRTCPLAFELARAGAGPLDALSSRECGSPFFQLSFEDAGLTRTSDDTRRFTGSGTLRYRPLEQLAGRLTVGYDVADQDLWRVIPVEPTLTSASSSPEGHLGVARQRDEVLTVSAAATATLPLSDGLAWRTTLGGEWTDEESERLLTECRGFPAGAPSCAGATTVLGTTDASFQVRSLGVYARQRLSWRDRATVGAGLRVDEASVFGDDAGLQLYPQVDASYRWTASDWLPGWWDELRLRAAWGQAGKHPPAGAAAGLVTTRAVPFGGGTIGVSPVRPPNPGLGPARVSEVELGLEAEILDGRLDAAFTWYRQTTSDDVIVRPLPPSSGFRAGPFANLGGMRNTGIEAGLRARAVDREGLRWDWRARLATNANEVTAVAGPIDFGYSQRHAEGRRFGAYHARCVDATDLSVSSEPVFGCAGEPGGDPIPDLTGSLSSTVTLFDRLTLYAMADFATGHQLLNRTEAAICGDRDTCVAAWEAAPDGSLTRGAEVIREAGGAGAELNFVEDADWVKLRAVSLRLDLPEAWTRSVPGSEVTVQVTGEDLAVWTPYPRDPEMTVGGQETSGFAADFFTLPPGPRATASVEVTF